MAPPPLPKRVQIVDQIVSLLGNITIANDFFTDLGNTGTISRNINAIKDANANIVPFVSVMFNNYSEEPNTASNQTTNVTINVFIDCFVLLPSDGSDPYTELDKLMADIQYALFKGTPAGTPTNQEKVSLQGLVFVGDADAAIDDTKITNMFNDQGLLSQDGFDKAWGRINLQITYHTDVLKP